MVLPLVALVAVHFAGGTANDLAKSLAETSALPVFIVQAQARPYGPFDYDLAVKNYYQDFKDKLSLRMSPGTDLIFTDFQLPHDLMPKFAPAGPAPTLKQLTPKDIAAGKVTFATEKAEALDLESLSSVPFSKPVVVNWFYKPFVVSMNVKEQGEIDFLKFLAKGLGAKVSTVGQTFAIEQDPLAIRQRALHTLQTLQLSNAKLRDSDKARLQFTIAVLQLATDEQLLEALKTPDGETKIAFQNGSNVAVTGLALVQALEKNVLGDGSGGPQPGATTTDHSATGNSVLDRIDPRRPVYAVLNGHLDAQLEIPVRGGGRGRNGGGGVVRM